MRDVKDEKFGSRNSILEDLFEQNNIRFIKNLWFVTCRAKINSDRNTRYLVFIESNKKINTDIFSSYVPVFRLYIFEDKTIVINLRGNNVEKFYSKEGFRNWIVQKTNCKYVISSSSGSKESSKFSRFFRENMGKGFSLTDVDFFITDKSVFVEEKTFVQNGVGLLGHGQYISFIEIKNDICPKIDFHIVLNDEKDFYLVNLNSIDPGRIVYDQNWGKMIEFDLGRKYTIDEIIEKYK